MVSSPLLGHANATDIPIRVNGLRILNGHLYFTNSRLGTFSRIRIDQDGKVVPRARIELVAELLGHDATHLLDDFDFYREENAYVTAHPGSLVKITPDGKVTTVIGGDDQVVLEAPTASAFGKDGKALFVTSMAGQVVRVTGL